MEGASVTGSASGLDQALGYPSAARPPKRSSGVPRQARPDPGCDAVRRKSVLGSATRCSRSHPPAPSRYADAVERLDASEYGEEKLGAVASTPSRAMR